MDKSITNCIVTDKPELLEKINALGKILLTENLATKLQKSSIELSGR